MVSDAESCRKLMRADRAFNTHLYEGRVRRVLDRVARGHRLLSMTPAAAAFSNSIDVLDTSSPGGSRLRLVVKRMTDDPDPERATADFHGLQIARNHGVPAPEPLLLDATGELLGAPGLVTRFVEGKQIANPPNPVDWANDLADLLLKIHDISLKAQDRNGVYDDNDLGLYFLTGEWPKKMSGHPLSDPIYAAIEELRSGIDSVPPAFVHMDFWPGNVLWLDGQVSAVVDWDAAAFGDPALGVGFFRVNMYLRAIKEAADDFLERYEGASGPVLNLGFWELARAAGPLPDPAAWIPASRRMGDLSATGDRAGTDYYEFISEAMRRARDGR